jgi:hypothetical protein
VLGVLALLTSHLYPWMEPLADEHGQQLQPGVETVLASLQDVSVAGGILLALAVLLAAIVLRPLQISAVQLLEGYWNRRPLNGRLQALATERHIRRRSFHRLRVLTSEPTEFMLPLATFDLVAQQARRHEVARRRIESSEHVVNQYPSTINAFMPTLLGNVLRRAESTAGER